MRVLIIKTSSMGDIIHTLPAIADAKKMLPNLQIDWVVEEKFAEIPKWHTGIDRVIPVALRRWRKNIFSKETLAEWRQFRQMVDAVAYDLIIDAQGLLKSALLSRLCKGVRCGLDWQSAREPLASLFYQRRYAVRKDLHAVLRVRELVSQSLGYVLPLDTPIDYGIDRGQFIKSDQSLDYVVFLHGTTWTTKCWPEEYWIQLAKKINAAGYKIKLPWGNSEEEVRAKRIAAACQSSEVLPRLNLAGVAQVLAGAKAVVSVDTGFGHLAAALSVPTISLYGPTDSRLTGMLGPSQVNLSAAFPCAPCLSRTCLYPDAAVFPPCFTTLLPEKVWEALEMLFMS